MALVALLGAGWLAYWPGLSGGFLFDDFANLDALGKRGPVDNWPAFWRYITSGSADPTGRPLSLLSFLLDARDWPADPRPFLRTNVLLHLLNGALLFGLLRQLGRHLDGPGARNDATALLGAGLWLLHPLLVSTTLYVVQREAMLPATFMLLGLMAYVHGRLLLAYAPQASWAAMAWMVGGIGLGTLLAVASKANGLLLPLLAWVLEATVLRAGDRDAATAISRRLRPALWLLLVLPTLVVAAWLARFLPRLHDTLATRPWTIAERLLTEPRVLMEYLGLLVVPRSVSTGLFNDGYVVSTSLSEPASTLPALLGVLALLALGVALRSRAPVLAAGLLFFFAGHLLESTVVPLELYFEHRNYLPALLAGWPLARALVGWRTGVRLRTAVAIAMLALLAVTTWQRAGLWGDPERLAMLWAVRNAESPRAQASAAIRLSEAGDHAAAARVLRPLWQRQPGEPQLAFNYVNARCAAGGLAHGDVAAVAHTLRTAPAGQLLVHQWLGRAMALGARGGCRGLDLAVAATWLEAALDNPAMAAPGKREQNLVPLQGELAVWRGQPDAALEYFREAVEAHASPDFAARLVALLAGHGHYRQALALLDEYEAGQYGRRVPGGGMARVHAWVLDRQGYWEHEFAVLRQRLRTSLADADASRPLP